MITTDELVIMTESEEQSPFKLGIVVELFTIGTAKVQLDGEEEPSEKEYSYLASYNPVVGDRVLLASVAGTYVIMDKVMYKEVVEEDTGDGSGSFTSLAVDGNTKTGTLNVTSRTTIEGATNLNGGVNVKQIAKLNGGAVVTGDVDISGTGSLGTLKTNRIEHTYNGALGFFGAYPTSRETVWTLMSSASTSDTISKLNELLRALKKYGLIHTD